jgi:hypothetical protein
MGTVLEHTSQTTLSHMMILNDVKDKYTERINVYFGIQLTSDAAPAAQKTAYTVESGKTLYVTRLVLSNSTASGWGVDISDQKADTSGDVVLGMLAPAASSSPLNIEFDPPFPFKNGITVENPTTSGTLYINFSGFYL